MGIIPVPPRQGHQYLTKRHVHLRRVLVDLHTKVFKHVSKNAFLTCARQFGLLEGKTLHVENETEMNVLWDYCLYRHLVRGRSAVQSYLRKHAACKSGSDELLVLSSMAKAHYYIVEVKSVEREIGVTARDLLRGGTFFLMDRNFGSTASAGCVLAANVLALPEFSMTTGAALPVPPGLLEMLADAGVLDLETPTEAETGDPALDPKEESELARIVISLALELGWSESITYR